MTYSILQARNAQDKFNRKEITRDELRNVHAFNVLEAKRGLDRDSIEYIELMKWFSKMSIAWHVDYLASVKRII